MVVGYAVIALVMALFTAAVVGDLGLVTAAVVSLGAGMAVPVVMVLVRAFRFYLAGRPLAGASPNPASRR